ncbi:hypothetical protein BH11ACT3_BH11ACT3_25390 [soil metagenome]
MTFPLPFDPPVDPDKPAAHDLLATELAKSPYQDASNFLQQLIKNFTDWLDSLKVDGSGPPSVLLLFVVAAVVAAALVAAFFLFGLPRLNRRSTVTGSLFGDDDARDAAAMRRDAERAAATGDYATAIAELFRSIARGLAERTVVSSSPGTTAREFARQAGAVFPESQSALQSAAISFDSVRYLDAAGTAEQWTALVALEKTLRSARPAHDLLEAGVVS